MEKKEEFIEVLGARVHNLKNIDVKIPRNKLVVITGLSGSGKSSLAFDTIYAEGQRRYIETFSAYARQFLGGLERPDVDKIDGLSPVIAIEQKTTSKSPRSTVGTITEIYDFLRLLYARVGTAYSYKTGEKMVSFTDEQIQNNIVEGFKNKRVNILAPVIRSRKGHYRELFEQIAKQGFLKVRIDGEIKDIEKGMKVDRYKIHDIEVVVDRLKINDDINSNKRLSDSIATAMKQGNSVMMILEHGKEKPKFFSRNLMCPTSGISYPNPEPNNFSFNSPKGACPKCNGLGEVFEINLDRIIPDANLSIRDGGLEPHGKEKKNNWVFKQLKAIAEHFDFDLKDPIETIPEEALNIILHGGKARFEKYSETSKVSKTFSYNFEGVAKFIEDTFNQKESSASLKRWAKKYMDKKPCETCKGSRLQKESLYYKIDDKNIADIVNMDVDELVTFFKDLLSRLGKSEKKIAEEIIKE